MLYIWEEHRGIRKEAQENSGELYEHWHRSKRLLPTHAETCWACKESSWVGRMEWHFYSIGQLRQRWRALSYWSLTNRWIRANSALPLCSLSQAMLPFCRPSAAVCCRRSFWPHVLLRVLLSSLLVSNQGKAGVTWPCEIGMASGYVNPEPSLYEGWEFCPHFRNALVFY